MSNSREPADQRWRTLCWAVRVTLIIGLLIGLVFDLSQLEGKGWEMRAVFYSLVMGLLSLTWRLSRKRFAYSYLGDTLIVAPFTVDILGNLFGLYDSVDHFDDILHFLNWMLLVGAFTVSVLRSSSMSRMNAVMLGGGFGATTIILWEAIEFVVMKLGTERLFLSYEDTIGDLLLSSSGGYVGALLVALLLRRTSDQRQNQLNL